MSERLGFNNKGEGDPNLETVVSLGRPLAPVSVHDVKAAFDEVLPPDVSYVPREQPSVNYVSAQELAAFADSFMLDSDTSTITDWIGAMIIDMCSDHRLEEATALIQATANIDYLRFKDRPANSRYLQIRVWDKRSQFYSGGYLLNGEKTAFMKRLGLDVPKTERRRGKPPRSIINIGRIVGQRSLLTEELFEDAKQLLNENVRLGPIGPINVLGYKNI